MILLIAYGNSAYAKFASNLAYSIKRFCNVHITLASDGCHEGYDMSKIDRIIQFSPAYFLNDPCLIKISLDVITPYEHTIYLDVDMLCLKDPTELFERITKQSFWIHSLRQTSENWWMKADKMAKYGCNPVFNDVNSSIMAFSNKPGYIIPYFLKLRQLYNKLEKRDLKNCWGKRKLIPDEVLHSCILQDALPSTVDVHYCDYPGVNQEAYFLSMYGFGIAKADSKQMYEKIMKECNQNYYPLNSIYKHKFVGK